MPTVASQVLHASPQRLPAHGSGGGGGSHFTSATGWQAPSGSHLPRSDGIMHSGAQGGSMMQSSPQRLPAQGSAGGGGGGGGLQAKVPAVTHWPVGSQACAAK